MKINSEVIRQYRKFNSEIYDLRSLARKVYKEVERVNDPAATQDSIDKFDAAVRERPHNGV